jgi:hypothetical protein
MNLKKGKDDTDTLTLVFKGTIEREVVRDLQKLIAGYADESPMALPAGEVEVSAPVVPPKSVKVGKATLVPADAPVTSPPAAFAAFDDDPGMGDDFPPAPPRARSPLDELADDLGT